MGRVGGKKPGLGSIGAYKNEDRCACSLGDHSLCLIALGLQFFHTICRRDPLDTGHLHNAAFERLGRQPAILTLVSKHAIPGNG